MRTVPDPRSYHNMTRMDIGTKGRESMGIVGRLLSMHIEFCNSVNICGLSAQRKVEILVEGDMATS